MAAQRTVARNPAGCWVEDWHEPSAPVDPRRARPDARRAWFAAQPSAALSEATPRPRAIFRQPDPENTEAVRLDECRRRNLQRARRRVASC